MRDGRMKIGIVAPGSRIDPGIAEKVAALAGSLYPRRPPDLHFHPQCFLSSGHFAGIGLNLVAAILAPNDQPDACGGSVAERHRRAGLGFHSRS